MAEAAKRTEQGSDEPTQTAARARGPVRKEPSDAQTH